MDILKKLKGVFIVEDETKTQSQKDTEELAAIEAEVKSTPTTPTATAASNTSNTQNTNVSASFDPKSLDGKPADQKFIDILFGAIEKANIDGFDYLEFKESLISLGKMNMDEPTKFKSALAMANTMNATPQKLVEAANHYLKVLKDESDRFGDAVNNQRKKIDHDQNQGIAQLQQSIASKEQQIKQLQQTIEDEKKQLDKMTNDIQGNKNKVEETAAKFNQAYTLVTSQIVEDIKKITQYGPA